MSTADESSSSPSGPVESPGNKRIDSIAKSSRQIREQLAGQIKTLDSKRAIDAVLDAPKRMKREWEKTGATGAITKFPIPTILVFLLLTVYFVTQSGFLDDTQFDDDPENPALNVNGDMEVYLPDGSKVAELISKVEEDWSTNVMVVYIESSKQNITQQRILQEISYVENILNPYLSDDSDDVIYILSLSTVLKEVNSSAPRIREAIVTEIGELGCANQNDDCASRSLAEEVNDAFALTDEELGGSYEVPSQTTIDLVIGEMYEEDGSPSSGLDKLARDIEGGEDGGPDGILDRAIMAIAVTESRPAKDIIEDTQEMLDTISKMERPCEFTENGDPADNRVCDWEELGLSMVLTGPVPITNAVTEFSFRLFWEIFPMAVLLVAIGLFIFHSDLLQTGLTGMRPLQGFKVLVIAGLPTLCAVFWTLGILGATNYEVTMTVIIVGPILLALGVSYGLHITNRYAEEEGTRDEKMRASLSSTGRAVFLSAVTTVIGFISLVFTPMAPIQTVGIALSGGIVVVYFLTMFMVPNLTLILDLKKPKHPPLKAFDVLVEVPLRYNKGVIGVFLLLILVSATVGQANVEENIDLLGMAPEGESSVVKMKQYSQEFEAGQVGMVLVNANVSGDSNDNDNTNDDPVELLTQINTLEASLNNIENTTAVSVVFLMKSSGIQVTVSGEQFNEFIQQVPCAGSEQCEDVKTTAEVLLNQSQSIDGSFWDLLTRPGDFGLPGSQQSEIFLLDVFYASLTKETREIFISSDYSRSLIYVDMPFIPVADTSKSVDLVNERTSSFTGLHGETAEDLTGVAATAIEVNELIVGSQWTSLGFAIILTLITLAVVFRDIRYSIWTTSPVIATVALQWLVMWQMDVPLSLVTVMIGSILVGVGVDFSIHIANRIRELGGGIDAIRSAAVGTGMSLFEAAVVTSLGMFTAYNIPIPEIQPFITVILILLWVAAASALILLPAIFVTLEKMGIGAVSGSNSMAKKLGLVRQVNETDDIMDAALVDDIVDAW
ncbi:MAG: MMPL family transporter [Candidatus Poseidonia sp.]|nr:MMPL family transporter [Poseidonia sp.]MBL6748659.1 MMPL family transporter [Poseidonia sp.]MBL6805902.1 MMPL family transporter [Poseidonia sp.]MBL6891982.1 MMPL family transporter [Poseidonia sp.]